MRLDFHDASVHTARERLAEDLRRLAVPDTRVDDARVVLSELVANSVRHARPLADGRLVVGWRMLPDVLLLSVTDGGSGTVPHRCAPPRLAISGRGLAIVETLAVSWGVQSEGPSTTVWAEIDRR